MFESGARPQPARAVYCAYIEQPEVFVGIYWQRYEWTGADMTISGLEDEFRLSARMPLLLYLKRPVSAMEPGLRRMLDEIRAEGGLAYKVFADAGELRELLLNDLATLLTERFGGAGHGERPYTVPSPVTALVGRDRDIDEVVKMLEALDRRLIVLPGTGGGIGKTRLALAVAGEGRERPLGTLGRRLADRHMLVVLDNFEQVLDAAPVLADPTGRYPLVTRRGRSSRR